MLTFKQLDLFAQALLPTDAPSSVRARLQEMQRRGFPAGVNTASRGRTRVAYDLDMTMQICIALSLARLGLSIAEAVAVASRGAPEIRECYADAAASAFELNQITPDPSGFLLVQALDRPSRSAVRFDALRSGQMARLPLVGTAAIIIDLGAIAVKLADHVDAEIRRELGDQLLVVQDLVRIRRHRQEVVLMRGAER